MSYSFPELGLLSLGLTICMITGGIDLSIVGTANLTSILAAKIMVEAIPENPTSTAIAFYISLAVGVAFIVGIAAGFINGYLVSTFHIHPVLVTLGTWQAFSGIATIITEGYAIPNLPEPFLFIGNGQVLGLAMPMYIFLVLAVVVAIMLRKTQFGRSIYFIGTNTTAALFAGIRVRTMLMRAYISSAVLATTAGLLMISHTNQAKVGYGESYILQAVLVNLLAGVSWNGGFGRVIGVAIAVLTLQFLSSGFNMMRFNNFARDFTWGMFLILIMIFNHLMSERRNKLEADIVGAKSVE